MSALTSGQRQFVSSLARRTGLDPRVLQAWALAEESGGAAQKREAQGNQNWLNIGYFDSGPGAITKDQAFGNPRSAAHATEQFLRGQKFGASSGIRHILSTAGHDPQAQIKAIAGSGWASSGYRGGSTLRQLFSQYGSQAPSAAAGPRSGRSVGGAVRPSPTDTRATTRTVTTQPAVDNSQARREALAAFLTGGGTDPVTGQTQSGDILQLALQMRALKDSPAVTQQVTVPGATRAAGGGNARAASVAQPTSHGASSALGWVRSKVGAPGSAETGGANRGQLASYLNKRFGFSGAPWCAMFTSAAVTKGGAPMSARTASVAEVRAK